VRRWRSVLAGAGIAWALAACAGLQPSTGVYHSSKGYRVTLPGDAWVRAPASRGDLELQHRTARAGMLVNASCESGPPRRAVGVLGRELLAGFSGREVQEQGTASVAGREAAHAVVEGHTGRGSDRVRVELYVVQDDRCVYDLLYAAAPGDFGAWREDFRRLVGTFALD
jgi:hypothetical protein